MGTMDPQDSSGGVEQESQSNKNGCRMLSVFGLGGGFRG